jgi:hypothetical protein
MWLPRRRCNAPACWTPAGSSVGRALPRVAVLNHPPGRFALGGLSVSVVIGSGVKWLRRLISLFYRDPVPHQMRWLHVERRLTGIRSRWVRSLGAHGFGASFLAWPTKVTSCWHPTRKSR